MARGRRRREAWPDRGQRELGEELKDKPAGYVGARVAKRLTTDCYARGVCRGAVRASSAAITPR